LPGEPTVLPADVTLLCPDCGYDLRVRPSGRCPECGLTLDFIDAPQSAIPWVRRREIGRVRAYLLTVIAVLMRFRVVSREIFRPVSHPDAQRFRLVSTMILLLSLVPIGFSVATGPAPAWSSGAAFGAPFGITLPTTDESWIELSTVRYGAPTVAVMCLAIVAGVLAFLLVLTGVPSYLFHPRRLPVEQQNRALALSYYATAPLALSPLVLPAAFGLRLLNPLDEIISFPGLCAALLFLLVGGYWLLLIRSARRSLRSLRSVYTVALLTPALWFVVGSLSFAVVALVIFYVWIMLQSLL
jgi:hypothetical protein